MDTNMRRDLNISGVLGGCGGGTFNTISINGSGTMNGNVDCIRFVASGRAAVRGSMIAESVEVNGSASFGERLDAGKLRINGKTDIEGMLVAGEMRVDGYLKVGGDVKADSMEINGSFTGRGSCEAERFRSRGSFRLDGLLNAGSVDIDLFAECRAKEIGGETIVVRKTGVDSPIGRLVKALVLSKEMLFADLIEGDEIRLEYTKAAVVRGTNVTIGPGCDIGLVEYTGEFRRFSDAVVGCSKQIG
ncbi:cytoplasmic protein [Paenibacillus sp. GYB003]|uniref:cytoplasmic protein n=1 Tax=Paenibacillus sp. GYB003 TaxID=2994392 RepID=UPI002F96BE55